MESFVVQYQIGSQNFNPQKDFAQHQFAVHVQMVV